MHPWVVPSEHMGQPQESDRGFEPGDRVCRRGTKGPLSDVDIAWPVEDLTPAGEFS